MIKLQEEIENAGLKALPSTAYQGLARASLQKSEVKEITMYAIPLYSSEDEKVYSKNGKVFEVKKSEFNLKQAIKQTLAKDKNALLPFCKAIITQKEKQDATEIQLAIAHLLFVELQPELQAELSKPVTGTDSLSNASLKLKSGYLGWIMTVLTAHLLNKGAHADATANVLNDILNTTLEKNSDIFAQQEVQATLFTALGRHARLDIIKQILTPYCDSAAKVADMYQAHPSHLSTILELHGKLDLEQPEAVEFCLKILRPQIGKDYVLKQPNKLRKSQQRDTATLLKNVAIDQDKLIHTLLTQNNSLNADNRFKFAFLITDENLRKETLIYICTHSRCNVDHFSLLLEALGDKDFEDYIQNRTRISNDQLIVNFAQEHGAKWLSIMSKETKIQLADVTATLPSKDKTAYIASLLNCADFSNMSIEQIEKQIPGFTQQLSEPRSMRAVLDAVTNNKQAVIDTMQANDNLHHALLTLSIENKDYTESARLINTLHPDADLFNDFANNNDIYSLFNHIAEIEDSQQRTQLFKALLHKFDLDSWPLHLGIITQSGPEFFNAVTENLTLTEDQFLRASATFFIEHWQSEANHADLMQAFWQQHQPENSGIYLGKSPENTARQMTKILRFMLDQPPFDRDDNGYFKDEYKNLVGTYLMDVLYACSNQDVYDDSNQLDALHDVFSGIVTNGQDQRAFLQLELFTPRNSDNQEQTKLRGKLIEHMQWIHDGRPAREPAAAEKPPAKPEPAPAKAATPAKQPTAPQKAPPKAAPKQPATPQKAPPKAAPKQPAAAKTAPPKAAPKQPATPQKAPPKAAPKQPAAAKTAPPKAAPKQPATPQKAPPKAAPKQPAAPQKAPAQAATTQQPAATQRTTASQPQPQRSSRAQSSARLFDSNLIQQINTEIEKMRKGKFKKGATRKSYWPDSYSTKWNEGYGLSKQVANMFHDYKHKRSRRGHVNRHHSDLAKRVYEFCENGNPDNQAIARELINVLKDYKGKSSSTTGSFYRRLMFAIDKVNQQADVNIEQLRVR